LIDQSALTGESVLVEADRGKSAYAGSLVKRGEASGEVVATGGRTFFGRTAELVRSAETVSHLQSIIFSIVKYLVAMDTVLAVGVFLYALLAGMPLADTASIRFDPAGRFGSGRAAGHLHFGNRTRRGGISHERRSRNASVGDRGSGGDGHVVERQDRNDHKESRYARMLGRLSARRLM
jgi:hypothetical protein